MNDDHAYHGFHGFARHDDTPPDAPDDLPTLDERIEDIEETLYAARHTERTATGQELHDALEAFADDARVRELLREVRRATREARRAL